MISVKFIFPFERKYISSPSPHIVSFDFLNEGVSIFPGKKNFAGSAVTEILSYIQTDR